MHRHPNAYGEYGLSPTNPMLAEDIMESKKLLSELRLPDGSPIRFEREGSLKPENLIKPVDKYGIFDETGSRVCTLYMYAYYHGTVHSAPEGFILER